MTEQERDLQAVLARYPGLVYDPAQQSLAGVVCIDPEGNDCYELLIRPGVERFPKVWETADRIPRKADRHINGDGSLCFTSPTLEQVYLRRVRTLEAFFGQILIPWLQNNSYFELTGQYAAGEFSHNPHEATMETYETIFGEQNRIVLMGYLDTLIRTSLSGNSPCFCGSGKKLRKCSKHFEAYQDFKSIPPAALNRDFILIVEYWFLKSVQIQYDKLLELQRILQLKP